MVELKIYPALTRDMSFIEVPTELSYTIAIAGCTRGCVGCFWDDTNEKVTTLDLESALQHMDDAITCVCFMGLDWDEDALLESLLLVKKYGRKTALYAGVWEVGEQILHALDYAKLAPYEMGVKQPEIKKVENGKII